MLEGTFLLQPEFSGHEFASHVPIRVVKHILGALLNRPSGFRIRREAGPPAAELIGRYNHHR